MGLSQTFLAQPQGLHQDQGVKHMGGVQEAPWSMNTMYVLDDFTAENVRSAITDSMRAVGRMPIN